MSDPVTITPNLNDAVTAAQSLLQQTTEQAIAAATSAAVATTASASIIYDHIYGLYGIDPTLRPSGAPMQDGDIYFNTVNQQLKMRVNGTWKPVAVSVGSASLLASNNLSDLTSIPQARSSLGLGTAAIQNIGVAGGLATLDGSGLVPLSQLPAGAAGLIPTNNLSDVSNITTARTNLGLGTAATKAFGGANGTATLDGSALVPMAQIPTGANKVATLNSSGFVPFSQLNAGNPSGLATLTAGGLVTPAQLPAGSSPTTVAKSSNYTTVSGDSGLVIAVTTGSSADVSITLVGASTSGDGATMTIQKVDAGTKKVVVLDSNGTTNLAWLSNQSDIVAFRSDGSVWQIFRTAISPRVETFGAGSSTWTKPPLAAMIALDMQGAGGGGGSGGVNNGLNNIDAVGGGGGGGGARYFALYRAAELGATEAVVVAAGGNGGVALSTTSGTGNSGSVAGNTTFGTITKLMVGGGSNGIGGSVWGFATTGDNGLMLEGASTPSSNARNAVYGGGSGQGSNTAAVTAGGSSLYGAGGGGAGGSVNAATTKFAPSAGGQRGTYTIGGGAAAGASGTTGSNGTSGTNPGVGGGGGGAGNTVCGNGGNGGIGAGGGGGGATGAFPATSGAGGKGGDGQVIVTTMFIS